MMWGRFFESLGEDRNSIISTGLVGPSSLKPCEVTSDHLSVCDRQWMEGYILGSMQDC